jgi:DNA-binding transcriptional ArsR family regulator
MSTDSLRRKPGNGRPFVATVEQAVLTFLSDDPHQSYYDSEVAEKTGLSRGAVNGALRALAKSGLLRVEQKGRMKFYAADLDDARVRAFKSLLNITCLAPLVQRLSRHALRVVLFGSAAEGRNTLQSDFDLFVLTNTPDAVRRLIPTQGLRVQAVVVTPTGLAELERKEPVFASQVKKGLELWQRT